MATVDNDGVTTTLPENIVEVLVAAFALKRDGIENITNPEWELLFNYAEAAQDDLPGLMMAMALGLDEVVQEHGQEAGNIGGVLRRRLLPDVQNGEVVFTSMVDYLREHPDYLAAIREGEPCNICDEVACPAHPCHYVPDGDCEDVELPENLEQALDDLLD